MMNNWNGFGGWGMGFGFVFMLLFWGLVILGIVALIRWLIKQPSPDRSPRDKTPLEIARERYARGEMDREEYERMKRDLES
ncbi:SHOCT domain-containing protein [Sideroxydans sp.]|jgi:putative membrane protein